MKQIDLMVEIYTPGSMAFGIFGTEFFIKSEQILRRRESKPLHYRRAGAGLA